MEYLDYDGAEEDLTVVVTRVTSEEDVVFSEVGINSTLLKMLSPWWKTKLTATGFKDSVRDGRCVVVHDSPEVAELALRAAKLRLSQEDLQADADLNSIFKLWRLADLWQFGYLSKMCQVAMTSLLTKTDEATLKEFVESALQHSDTVLDDVLVPLFVENPQFRSPRLYLAFDDLTLFTLAEVAPIAGFQTRSEEFHQRLAQYVNQLDDDCFVRFMLNNPEARLQVLYSERSLECCMLACALAPLPLVSSMVKVVLDSNWSSEQKEVAISAIDFDRLISADQKFFSKHHKQLPYLSNVWHTLWLASMRQLAVPYLSIACSAPWAVAFTDEWVSETKEISAGPVTVVLHSRGNATFRCVSPAYGIVGSPRGSWSSFQRVVQPGTPFSCDRNTVLIVYESPRAVALDD